MRLRILALLAAVLVLLPCSASAAKKPELAEFLLDTMVVSTEVGLANARHEGNADWLASYVIDRASLRYPERRGDIERVVNTWWPVLVGQVQDSIPPMDTESAQALLRGDPPKPVWISDELRETWRTIIVAELKAKPLNPPSEQ